jgi:hypothetical protein
MTAATLDAALAYARRGWPVLPLHGVRAGGCSCGNNDCGKSTAKHPRTSAGLLDATLDEAQIRTWWRWWPDANVGIRTGAESALVVIDVDPRNGGDESLHDLERRLGPLPPTVLALTGGGGRHFLFAHPQTRAVACARNFAGFAGLDLKADGGYVVAAPSLHASGRSYCWDVGAHPDDVALAPFPSALLALAAEDRASARVSYKAEQWDGTLPARASAAILASPRIRRRFDRSTEGLRDDSPSGVDASLATMLALARVDAADVESALRASRAAAGLPPRLPSYYRATVGMALEAAQQRHESARLLGIAIVEGLRHA